MKTGLIITTYNRPYYLAQCLDTVRAAFIPEGTLIIIVDDTSTDQETINLVSAFTINGIAIIKIFKKENKTVCDSLLIGIERAFQEGCDTIINLDGDAIVSALFMDTLLRTKALYPDHILTGFNCKTKNRDGSERHEIIDYYIDQKEVVFKYSVGGINMCFNEKDFEDHIRLALVKGSLKQGNWDHLASISAANASQHIACLRQSVVQHIGIDSSMGHHEAPDVADDFYELYLPNVTLICVDCVDIKRAVKALDISSQRIKFGSSKLITSVDAGSILHPDERVIEINHIGSVKEYSEFMINNLYFFINTEFALIVQHDGYVLRPSAWKEEFLNYDYIGAKWNQYLDNNVGNGGFSLRSKKLMKALAKDPVIQETHPEDHVIGRTYRAYLEKHHDIKFAPSKLADEFSIEAHQNPNPVYNGQFGFHGREIDFTKYHMGHIPYLLKAQNGYVNKRDMRRLTGLK